MVRNVFYDLQVLSRLLEGSNYGGEQKELHIFAAMCKLTEWLLDIAKVIFPNLKQKFYFNIYSHE